MHCSAHLPISPQPILSLCSVCLEVMSQQHVLCRCRYSPNWGFNELWSSWETEDMLETPLYCCVVLRLVSPPLTSTLCASASRGLLESMVEKVTKEIDSELGVEMVLRESLKEAEYVDAPWLCLSLLCSCACYFIVHCVQGLVCTLCTCISKSTGVLYSIVPKDTKYCIYQYWVLIIVNFN